MFRKLKQFKWFIAGFSLCFVLIAGGMALAYTSKAIIWENDTFKIYRQAGQTANLLEFKSDTGTTTAHVQANGRLYTSAGIKSDALKYGASFVAWSDEGVVVEDSITNNAGNFDFTGGTYEQQFTDVVNTPFLQAYKDNKSWIIIKSGEFQGAMAEINTFISSSTVILHTMHWLEDINSVDYDIIENPMVIIGDGYHAEFQVNSQGHFDIHSSQNWIGSLYSDNMFEVEMEAGIEDVTSAYIEAKANGYTEVVGLRVDAISGDLGAGERLVGIVSNIDTSDAINADSSTRVASYVALVTNGSSATKIAYSVLTGFDEAFRVLGSPEQIIDYGYKVTLGSVASTTIAFSSSTDNITIFENENDYILIGMNEPFEVIDYANSIPSSKDIEEEYYYSTGNGTWSALTHSSGVDGFKQGGQVLFNAPVGWATSNEAEASGDITAGYYIKIVRTFSTNIPTLPVEMTFHTFENISAGMQIRGSGAVVFAKVGADPCPDTDRFPEASQFYNDTSDYYCFCDGAGDDLKVSDNSACF